MTVHISISGKEPETLLIFQRAESEGGDLGEAVIEVRPGESFLGWSYDELKDLGPGAHDLNERDKGGGVTP